MPPTGTYDNLLIYIYKREIFKHTCQAVLERDKQKRRANECPPDLSVCLRCYSSAFFTSALRT